MRHPEISIIIPTFNEENNIENCLNSIFSQDYPKSRLEVLIVDDDSTDETVELAKRFPVKILRNGKKHGEIGKMIGMKKSSGEFVIYLDADVELKGKRWFHKMLKPLLKNPDVIGAFTRKYARKGAPAIERYLTFDPLQRDSIYSFFSPSIEDSVVAKKSGYLLLDYGKGRIPPAGRNLYRRKELLDLVREYEMFLDLDFLVLLSRSGYDKFAYVPAAGLYHHHVSSFLELVRKRKYNLKRVYLNRNERLYKWFDLTSTMGMLKIVYWIVYANLFLPSVFVGVYKSLKYRDIAGLYEPIVNIVLTDIIVLNFLMDSRTVNLIRK